MQMIYEYDDQGNPKMREYELVVVGVMKTDYSKRGTEGNQFIGNIASGTESSADFTIQTANAGTLNGLLTVTYEDEKGNAKTLTKEFSMTVEAVSYTHLCCRTAVQS